MARKKKSTQPETLNVPETESNKQAKQLEVLTINNKVMEKDIKSEVEQQINTPMVNNVDNASLSENQETNEHEADSIFTEDKVFSLSDYIDKIVIKVIESNRKVDSQIQDKLKSCQTYGMLVPGILVDSSIAEKAGYECKVVFGTPDEGKPSFTVMEGHTRLYAVLLAMKMAETEPDCKVFDYCFLYKRFDDPKKFRDSYRAMNMSNVPTKTKDYVRDLLATGENKVLSSYQNKLKRKITAKAAGFATVNREIMKRDVNAIFKDSAPDYITDESILEFTTPVYEAVLKFFGCETGDVKSILKKSIIWSFNAEKFNKSRDKKEVSEKLVKLYNSMSPAIMSDILSAKSTVKKTKDQVIKEILETEYKKL